MAKTTQRSETMNHPKYTCNHINQKPLADRWDLFERILERWRAIGWEPYFLCQICVAWNYTGRLKMPPC